LSEELKQSMMDYFKKDFSDPSFNERNLTALMHQFGYNAGYEVYM